MNVVMTARWSASTSGQPTQLAEDELQSLVEFVAGGLDHAMAVAPRQARRKRQAQARA